MTVRSSWISIYYITPNEHYSPNATGTNEREIGFGSTIRNDIFAQVMGKKRHGRVRMYGFGVSPSDLWKATPDQIAYQNTRRDDM